MLQATCCLDVRGKPSFRLRSVNTQLEQSLAATISELSQTRADASMQDSVARQLEMKLEPWHDTFENVQIGPYLPLISLWALWGCLLVVCACGKPRRCRRPAPPARKKVCSGTRTGCQSSRSKSPHWRPPWELLCQLPSFKRPPPWSCSKAVRTWLQLRVEDSDSGSLIATCNVAQQLLSLVLGTLRTTFRGRYVGFSLSWLQRPRQDSSNAQAKLSSRTGFVHIR